MITRIVVVFSLLTACGCQPGINRNPVRAAVNGKAITEWTVEIGSPVTQTLRATNWGISDLRSNVIVFTDYLGVEHAVTGQVHIYSTHP